MRFFRSFAQSQLIEIRGTVTVFSAFTQSATGFGVEVFHPSIGIRHLGAEVVVDHGSLFAGRVGEVLLTMNEGRGGREHANREDEKKSG